MDDNHGNQPVQRIRGAVRPQHGGEHCAPCHHAGLADARWGVIPGSQRRAPHEKRTRHRLLSSIGGPSHADCGPASSVKGATGEAKARASEAPKGPGKPDLPAGPAKGFSAEATPPEPNIGRAGILAFKEQFASLAQDKDAPRLGTDARYAAADEVGQASSHSVLTTNTPGSSGGIDAGSLSRNVGGGGGRGGGGGGMGGPGLQVARAKSSIAGIGGGDGRPKAHSGPGASRTDEEIQIVFDRYKSAFYRDYNRTLRINPTLQGKMVLRLTIEPDGSVSMCQLQSTDMDSPDLVTQVVNRVKTINFGAKEGVQAVTICTR